MGINTKIEWCDSTVNAQMGCDGCELWTPKVRRCYAGTMTARYAGNSGWPEAFDKPKIFPQRILDAVKWTDLTGKNRPDKPWLDGYPRLIFLDDMGDTFTESLPLLWLREYIPIMADSPHIWMMLTKRPKRMNDFWNTQVAVPDNFWLMTSITQQQQVKSRLIPLLEIPAKVHGISVEPMLEDIDLHLPAGKPNPRRDFFVIAGGESGEDPRETKLTWFANLLGQCRSHNIPFFMKQVGGHPNKRSDWISLPSLLRVRELPTIYK